MTQQTRRAGLRERLGDGIAAGRLVRVSLVTAFVVLVLAGGAIGLWVSVDPVGPERTASKVDPPAAQPTIRLDTLPAPRGAARPGPEDGGEAKAAPVIGVGSGKFAEPQPSEASEAVVEVDGEKPAEEVDSDAEVKRQLAALERENARIEAALAGDQGPGTGTGRLLWPVRGGGVNSPFGPRWGRLHAGVDIDASTGTNVYAADTGRVALAGPTGGYGNYICIQHTRSLSTCYAHNSRLGVRKGQSVRKGALIAKSGATGSVTGPNMHFETRVGGKPVNPMRYF